MTHYTESFKKIREDFLQRNIPIERPGFYDHPKFMAVEKIYPEYLNNYARFVHYRQRSKDYDQLVKKKALIIAKIFHEKLKLNGRLGACIDISGLISRALEEEGIFNFVVKGSLTIDFPKKSKITRKYFWSVASGEFTAAHAWVVAPPLYVIDASVQLQPYSDDEAKHLPNLICSEAPKGPKGTLEDVVAPEVRAYALRMGIPATRVLDRVSPGTSAFMNIFPARVEVYENTTLKFVPVAVTAPDLPFKEMEAMNFNGKTGYEVYKEEIIEQLNTL